jgi:Amt family ammonium transporter
VCFAYFVFFVGWRAKAERPICAKGRRRIVTRMPFGTRFLLTSALLLCASAALVAQTPGAGAIDSGDTAFMLVSAALVMLMTPGLAFFYGGMVRGKNVLDTMMQSFMAVAIISVQWIVIGYSLAFGPDKGHVVGSLAWIGLRGVGMTPNPDYASTIPHQAYMIYQCMFAVITPALITGAVAERMKFKTYLVFMLLWSTLVYDVVAHWVWGTGGWLRNMGALDFAGGTVVHVSSGVSALVAALLIGRRRGYPDTPMPPHNLPYTLLGTGLLWFGWFGFNAGSAVTAGTASTGAFIATHVAAASAALGWVMMDWLVRGRPTALGAASGAVAGLVAITPASGYVGPLSSIVIGGAAGCVCFLAVILRAKSTVDDSLDVFGVHGTGGTLGALMTGLFAQKAINAAGADGLFFGNASLFGAQVVAVLATWAYAAAVTYVLLRVLDLTMGLRVNAEQEDEGLDVAEHGESAYALD